MSGKSIWAIAAGVIFSIVVSTLVDIVFHLTGVYPPGDQPIDDRLALLARGHGGNGNGGYGGNGNGGYGGNGPHKEEQRNRDDIMTVAPRCAFQMRAD